jgi:hypothetical protein
MPASGAGGPEFKFRRPDQNIAHVFFNLLKGLFTQNVRLEFRQTGGLDSQLVSFPGVRQSLQRQDVTLKSQEPSARTAPLLSGL